MNEVEEAYRRGKRDGVAEVLEELRSMGIRFREAVIEYERDFGEKHVTHNFHVGATVK